MDKCKNEYVLDVPQTIIKRVRISANTLEDAIDLVCQKESGENKNIVYISEEERCEDIDYENVKHVEEKEYTVDYKITTDYSIVISASSESEAAKTFVKRYCTPHDDFKNDSENFGSYLASYDIDIYDNETNKKSVYNVSDQTMKYDMRK